MSDLFDLGVSVADKIVRTIAVYVTIAVLLRIAGKRGIAQLNNFDFVVMLLMSNVVQNAIIGPDNSLVGGLVGVVILVAVNSVVVRLAATVPSVGRAFEGTPVVLARDGHFIPSALRRMGVRQADLNVMLQLRGPRASPTPTWYAWSPAARSWSTCAPRRRKPNAATWRACAGASTASNANWTS
ncbi:DUF421 domain-containing protein [Actinomadura sp. ATCC 39365]